MRSFLTITLITMCISAYGQNYITVGGDYKMTNSRFHEQGAGIDGGFQFAVNERLSIGPQAGYNHFEVSRPDVWSPIGVGTGAGDAMIPFGPTREPQSFYGGASAHYLLAGLEKKLQLHVGAGLNCHFFRELMPIFDSNERNFEWFARMEAQLPVSLVYIPNEDKRLRLFASIIPSYFAPSDAHSEISRYFGEGIAVVSFRVGVQMAMGGL